MNQISWQIYGGSNKKANTFIGGVASVITTSGVLAAKLGIASNRITNFKIVGSDIECRIKGSYIIYYFAYNAPSVYSIITYYRDLDGLVTSISEQAFYNTVIREVYTPNATSIGLAAFDQNLPINPNKNELKILYIPRVTTIGNTVLNNIVFRSGNLGGGKIYVHPSLQTINAGGVEGDLAYLATGNIIRYVTNFTAPNFITDLSAGTIYGTAIQLNFTAPTGSTNAIEFYEVWVNGVFKSIIISGQYITGLIANTTYTIEVKPVDILYNKSTSNTIIITTANISYTDTDANAYISAATLTSSEQESAYKLITDLKTAGLWVKIQALYPFKGTTAAQHKWNAKNPLDTNAAFRLTFNGTGTYSNLGFQCNGTNAFANTYLNNNIQNANNQGLTVVVGTNNTKDNSMEMGLFNANGYSYINVKRYTSNGERAFSANGVGCNQTGVFEARGIFTGTKLIQSTAKLFRNSTLLSTATNGTSLGLVNFNHYIGCINLNNGTPYAYSPQRIQIAIIHEGLTDVEVATLHSIIDTSETIAGRKTW